MLQKKNYIVKNTIDDYAYFHPQDFVYQPKEVDDDEIIRQLVIEDSSEQV